MGPYGPEKALQGLIRPLKVGWIVREPREETHGRPQEDQGKLRQTGRGPLALPSLPGPPGLLTLPRAPLTIHQTTLSCSLAWNCLPRRFPGPMWALHFSIFHWPGPPYQSPNEIVKASIFCHESAWLAAVGSQMPTLSEPGFKVLSKTKADVWWRHPVYMGIGGAGMSRVESNKRQPNGTCINTKRFEYDPRRLFKASYGP